MLQVPTSSSPPLPQPPLQPARRWSRAWAPVATRPGASCVGEGSMGGDAWRTGTWPWRSGHGSERAGTEVSVGWITTGGNGVVVESCNGWVDMFYKGDQWSVITLPSGTASMLVLEDDRSGLPFNPRRQTSRSRTATMAPGHRGRWRRWTSIWMSCSSPQTSQRRRREMPLLWADFKKRQVINNWSVSFWPCRMCACKGSKGEPT